MALRLFYTACAATAAALTVLATALAWASLRVPFVGTATRYGWEGDGIITLLLGLLAFGFALYTWVERRRSTFRLTALFTAFLGDLIFATALVNLLDSERAIGSAQSKLGIDLEQFIPIRLEGLVDTGAGVYVAIAAGIILAVGSALAFATASLQPSAAGTAGGGACPRCGAEPPPTARFCPACGSSLS